ncbi:FAD/NAD(P)-binding domain-containing protein [Lepidopterella palustris CBS 459.81]|uniref:FAD/NAD(P)-binding domain-containing protein n=1 Tax=Lepidopterella palustris CBS 459.81 TaxID=1314670 RepID=A0A8E2JB17_9PEZI|nr:FAD/NAD(P)-binding domain-containing protein [Lepidopterella palustris CBS 459.81]
MGSIRKDISVIIVGAGFGGLASSIELTRKGYKTHVFEYSPDLTRQGDVIMIGSNATRIIAKWGNVLEEMMKIKSQPDFLTIQDKNGKVLMEQPLPKEFDGFPNIYTSRTLVQNMMYEHAVKIGVEFTFNARVTEYFEEGETAGIVHNGQKYTADFVISADGVHSKGRAYVTGVADRAKKSGFAVYRSWFPLSRLLDNPLTKYMAESKTDLFAIWICEDTHAILTTNVNLQSCTCFATHKDYSDIEESWHLKGDVKEMVKTVEGWDPKLVQLIKSIPEDGLIDHKLLWRDPVRKWVSDKGRVCVVGDAAHPHLPTSGTGGASAIEDGATIATLVDKAGKGDIPLALRSYQALRYERTALTQRMGWETRHRWHQTDWEEVAKNPAFLKLPQPAWLNGYDAEQYALDNYAAVTEHVLKGTPFQSTNIPEGHVHTDWTIATMMAAEGEKAEEGFYVVGNE